MNAPVRDSLENILTSTDLIMQRLEDIRTPDDLLSDADALFTLDAVAMRLQIIGENVKSLAGLNPELLEKYPEVEWNKIMRLRDIISHHYDVLDHEIIFDACMGNLPQLRRVIETIIEDE